MNWADILRKKSLRCTPGRLVLLRALEASSRPHSFPELLSLLPKGTDRVTLYRSLEQLGTAGLIRTVYFDKDPRYELRDEHDHHHVVCTSCGKIQDIPLCAMASLQQAVSQAATKFATITDHRFEVFGLCKTCAKP